MSYSVNWATKVITVPLADLTFVSGSNYTLDTGDFWIEMRRLEASPVDGLWTLQVIEFINTQILSGLSYSAIVKIINGYTWNTDTPNIIISLLGKNSNLLDVFIPGNGVSVLANNSAGKIETGSGLSAGESTQLAQVHGQIRRCVFLDTEALVNGNGYQQTPWDNWSDAVDDAEALSLQKIEVASDATLDRNLSNFTVVGINLPTIDLAGFDCNNAIFNQVTLTGAQGTGNSPLLALTCNINSIADFNGSMLTVSVVGSIGIADGAFCLINQVIPAVGGVPWTLDMGAGGAASTVQVQNISGGVTVTNMDNASDSLHMAFSQGAVTIDASCTAGTIVLSGSAKVTDNSGVGCTVDVSAVDHELVMDHVMENGETFADQTRLIRADAAGDVDEPVDGTYAIRDAADTKDRIVGTETANGGRNVTSTDGS